MDTKLKNYRYHILTKTLLFLAIAFLLTFAFVEMLSMAHEYESLEALLENNFDGSINSRIQGLIAGSLVALVFLILLTLIVGKTDRQSQSELGWFGEQASDVMFIVYGIFVVLWFQLMDAIFSSTIYYLERMDLILILSGITTFGIISITGIYYLTVVKQVKRKYFIKSSIAYKVLYLVYDFFKSLFDGRKFSKNGLTRSLFKRQVLFIVSSAFLVFLMFLFLMAPPLMLLPPIIECFIIYWFVKGNRATYEAIDKGFNDSLEEQMKAERMKIQLVTNVSHDLKTPLTAIIGYVDLLAKEPLDETAKEYVTILAEKSDRLKHILSDLFDLAKSTSGNLEVTNEEIDLKRLIEQTLGDLSEEIEASSLEFKLRIPDKDMIIRSDGKKLYRVFLNLFDNALKYALQGTRVYIDCDVVQGEVLIGIKNIAGYEMTFTEEEIRQRFARGDHSRTSEGNGLGLSIAESFTAVCGGTFKLVIDGDLFKVELRFPSVK